jgi:PAS domain S-box-containing protein
MVELLEGIASHIGAGLMRKRAEDALHQASERLSLATHAGGVGIWELDLVNNVLFWDDQMFQLYGITPDKFSNTYEIWRAGVHPDDLAQGEAELQMALHGGKEFDTEFRVVWPDGTIHFIHAGACVHHDTSGKPMSLIGTNYDVTERRQAEEQIKASLVEREALLKEIHHRVKNNLQIISSLLHLEARKKGHPEVVEALMDSRSRVKSMALIHEKLYQSPNLARVDMADYAKSLTNYILESHNKVGSHVRVRVAAEGVSLDAESAIPCGLIINELVSNALKHAFPEGGAGEIGISFTYRNGDGIALVVRDNGIGLPDHLDFRNSPSLGLNLVCNLAKQLNGTIELDSKAGTTFTISFQPNMPSLCL